MVGITFTIDVFLFCIESKDNDFLTFVTGTLQKNIQENILCHAFHDFTKSPKII